MLPVHRQGPSSSSSSSSSSSGSSSGGDKEEEGEKEGKEENLSLHVSSLSFICWYRQVIVPVAIGQYYYEY